MKSHRRWYHSRIGKHRSLGLTDLPQIDTWVQVHAFEKSQGLYWYLNSAGFTGFSLDLPRIDIWCTHVKSHMVFICISILQVSQGSPLQETNVDQDNSPRDTHHHTKAYDSYSQRRIHLHYSRKSETSSKPSYRLEPLFHLADTAKHPRARSELDLTYTESFQPRHKVPVNDNSSQPRISILSLPSNHNRNYPKIKKNPHSQG